jgi:magnesium-transporting ATPase (P-type)
MTQAGGTPERRRADQTLIMVLAGVLGQIGCLTLVIILVALVAGLWLDNQFHTRPLFLLGLVLGSIPLTLYLMFRIVLAVAPRIQAATARATRPAGKEEPEVGDRSDSDPQT